MILLLSYLREVGYLSVPQYLIKTHVLGYFMWNIASPKKYLLFFNLIRNVILVELELEGYIEREKILQREKICR